MRSLPIDTSRLKFYVAPDGINPKLGRDDRGQPVQKTERDTGHLGWAVSVLTVVAGDKPEVIEVVVYGPQAPELPDMAQVEFGNLGARPWNMDTGASGVSFSADWVRVASALPPVPNGTKPKADATV